MEARSLEGELRIFLVPIGELRVGDLVISCPVHLWDGEAPQASQYRAVLRAPAPEPKGRQRRQRFIPPTVEEVAKEIEARGYRFDPEVFVNHYEANGWVQTSGRPIVSWKAAMVTFEKNVDRFGGKNTPPPASRPSTERRWWDPESPVWVRAVGELLAADPPEYVSEARQEAFGRWMDGEDVKDPG